MSVQLCSFKQLNLYFDQIRTNFVFWFVINSMHEKLNFGIFNKSTPIFLPKQTPKNQFRIKKKRLQRFCSNSCQKQALGPLHSLTKIHVKNSFFANCQLHQFTNDMCIGSSRVSGAQIDFGNKLSLATIQTFLPQQLDIAAADGVSQW